MSRLGDIEIISVSYLGDETNAAANTTRKIIPPRTTVEETVLDIWREILGIEQISLDDNFFELGGDSLKAGQVLACVHEMFHLEPSLDPIGALFQTPTIRALARRLVETNTSAAWSPLVAIQPNGTRPPFYCVHAVGGGVVAYAALGRSISQDQPFYGLQAYGVRKGQAPDTTIEAMATRYLDAIRQIQPHGPYLLGGYSFGGTVAFEMAQQLCAQGETVGLLAMIDHPAPNSDYLRVTLNRQFLTGFINNLPAWAQDFAQLNFQQQWQRIQQRGKYLASRPHEQNGNDDKLATAILDAWKDIPPERRALMRACMTAANIYQPKPYAGCVTVFRARRQPFLCSFDPTLGWSRLAKQVEICAVPGTHHKILFEPYVAAFAQELERYLAKAATPHSAR